MKTLVALSLALLTAAPAYAQPEQKFFNEISLYNNTDRNIAYRVRSDAPTALLYGIKLGRHTTYHSKFGDSNATFEVGECQHVNSITGLCTKYDAAAIVNCVNNLHYDASKIKSIEVTALNLCQVTCIDGTTTSCLAQ